jgi:hypothetical protein
LPAACDVAQPDVFHAVEDIGTGLIVCWVDFTVHALDFERRKESFDSSVVPDVA